MSSSDYINPVTTSIAQSQADNDELQGRREALVAGRQQWPAKGQIAARHVGRYRP